MILSTAVISSRPVYQPGARRVSGVTQVVGEAIPIGRAKRRHSYTARMCVCVRERHRAIDREREIKERYTHTHTGRDREKKDGMVL